MGINQRNIQCIQCISLGGLSFLLYLAGAILTPTSSLAQSNQELVTCMANLSPAVREPCIRTALQAQDPNMRAAGLAAVFRNRNLIVIEFEPPPSVAAFMQKIDAGQVRRSEAPQAVDYSINFIEKTGQQVAFRVDSFDNQTNTFSVTVRDYRFVEGRLDADTRNLSRGQGTISGESLQLGFKIQPDALESQCSSSLRLDAVNELKGVLSCTGIRTLLQTSARIRFF